MTELEQIVKELETANNTMQDKQFFSFMRIFYQKNAKYADELAQLNWLKTRLISIKSKYSFEELTKE